MAYNQEIFNYLNQNWYFMVQGGSEMNIGPVCCFIIRRIK